VKSEPHVHSRRKSCPCRFPALDARADPAFAASRLIHTIAVLTATALMFTPAANAYFKAFKGRQSNGFSRTAHSASG
jgi:hypothetical protein